MNTDQLIEQGLSGGGTPLLSISQLRELLPELSTRGLYVRSREAYSVDDEDCQTLRVEFSMLGLEGYDDAEADVAPALHRELLTRKLGLAEATGMRFLLNAWFVEAE